MTKHISASMEVSAKHVHDGKLQAHMFPANTRVYLTDVGVDPVDHIISATRKITDMGYRAVPHVPARRIESENALESRLSGLAQEGGATDLLVIAGEADRQMGPFSQSLDVLQTGFIDKLGFKDIAIGGHPEGNVAYGERDVMAVLKEKVTFGNQMDADMRLTTQFGFDGQKFIDWANAVNAAGIDLPIHLGVAGPAKITTLIKYAAMCGVGNSLNFFKKRTSAIAALATKHSPEDVVSPIEASWLAGENTIAQLHVFPFGGLQSSADWLTQRGSFAPSEHAA